MLRCRETLMMAAHLRLPEAMTDEAKEAYVDGIIQRLGMTKSADTIVGDAKVHSLSVRHDRASYVLGGADSRPEVQSRYRFTAERKRAVPPAFQAVMHPAAMCGRCAA